jgi:tetratricopeptide (TPR) repeat protein
MSSGNEWLPYAPQPRVLRDGERWNVFLSYRSITRPWVVNLYDVLRGLGHRVFLDQAELKPGDELITRLEDALRASQAGVLVWSSAAKDSAWVRKEYQSMERRSTSDPAFQFVPVRLDSTLLPEFAQNRIFLDFAAYPDGPNGGELLRLLHAVSGSPLSAEAARFAFQQDEAARLAAAALESAVMLKDPQRLLDLFAAGGTPWQTSAALGCAAANGLIRLDHNDDAIRVLEQISASFPRAVRPRQLHALALARRHGEGDLARAQQIVGEMYAAGDRDPETLGIYGRTWMDRYVASHDRSDLEQSRDLYAEAFDKAPDDFYTGINAAAKSLLLGGDQNFARALKYARRVQEIVGEEPGSRDYWTLATAGEALLIQGRYDAASRLYGAAVAAARAERASHRSTWAQACRLMATLQPTPQDRAAIRAAFAHLPDCDHLA